MGEVALCKKAGAWRFAGACAVAALAAVTAGPGCSPDPARHFEGVWRAEENGAEVRLTIEVLPGGYDGRYVARSDETRRYHRLEDPAAIGDELHFVLLRGGRKAPRNELYSLRRVENRLAGWRERLGGGRTYVEFYHR